MKKVLSILLMLMFIRFGANAYNFMVDGIAYKINSDGTSVMVTFINQNPDNYSGLITANIPNDVTYNGMTYLVTSIGYYAFHSCSGLKSVTIPESVTSIDDFAFEGCSGLILATIPNSVTTIGFGTFRNCTSLNTVIIGENVTSIGEKAFMNCSLLENLVALRERPIYINSNVFEGVPKASCDLHVREGSKIRYENQDVWKNFLIIVEDAEDWADVGGGSTTTLKGDVNGDGHVNSVDITIIYNILLGTE